MLEREVVGVEQVHECGDDEVLGVEGLVVEGVVECVVVV